MSSKAEKSDSHPRGGRLARRARSFKEDFFGKISQIRGPNMPRSSSPQKGHHHTQSEQSGKHKSSKNHDEIDGKKNKDVNCVFNHLNQLTKSLTYLQDVIKKDKLEMLSGSATVTLETVLAIYTTLCNCSPAIKDQSPELKAATNQVFQSLAELIRWSDEIFLCQNTVPNKENMGEVVNAVQEAVKALVKLSMEKQAIVPKETSRNSNGIAQNGVYSPKAETTQPEALPLTPREKEILKETNFTREGSHNFQGSHNSSLPSRNNHSTKSSLHHSNSSDSILSSSTLPRNGELSPTLLSKVVPPPKPPLPSERNPLNTSQSVDSAAPPLPPKKRSGSSGDRSLKTSQCHSSSMCSASLETTSNVSLSTAAATNNSCLASLNSFFPEISQHPIALDWLTNGFQDPFVTNENSMETNLNHSADDLLLMKNPPSNGIFHHRTKFQNESATASFKTMDVIDSGSKTISYSSTSYSSRKVTQATSSSRKMFTSVVGGNDSGDSLLQKMQSASLDTSTDEIFSNTSPSSPPPALPVKQRMVRNRTPSQYDNLVPEINLPNENANFHCSMNRENSRCGHLTHSQSMFNYPQCFSTSVSSCLLANGSAAGSQSGNTLCWRYAQEQQQQRSLHTGSCNILDDSRPPLPPKKKPVMAYMEMFGSSQPSDGEFYRHSMHTYNKVVQAQWQQAGMAFMQQQQYQQSSSFQSFSGVSLAPSSAGFVSSSDDSSVFSESRSSQGSWGDQSALCLSATSATGMFNTSLDNDEPKPLGIENNKAVTPVTPPALPPKKNRASGGKLEIAVVPPVEESSQASPVSQQHSPQLPLSTQSDYVQLSPIAVPSSESQFWSKESQELVEQGPLDELDVTHHLILKKAEEEGPDVRGGSTDALVIHAANPPRNDFSFQEAFLTTYRTFVSPEDLIQKLLYRYNRFIPLSDMRQRAARNAFSLLVRVVDDLCLGDMSDSLLRSLMDFIFQLVSHGELNVAKALRQRVIEKCEAKNKSLTASPLLSSLGVTTHQGLLVDFKSEHLAEQMTLLDANLFQKIEIPELLLWAQEQKEELSPNLTTFTEHFNKMSYWARSRILERDEAKDRERYVVKFIKIMKHLRKLNNFNSYLAILSALDSAPIRRLEWQRNITEGLKEYCALIDSSSSFRAYRQALAETEAPCIPYIGLILQDLTFVHIGNNNTLPDGNINFSKRWQQFNILENMRRFRNCQYSFKKDEHILTFFNNFDDYLCEEAMWQISESIKPRGGGGANANATNKK